MAGDLPTGTVTFLFTDVEGSTQLWEHDAPKMASALQAHDEIVRGAIIEFDGHVFSTGGDGFGAVFNTAHDAAAAAVAAQRTMSTAGSTGRLELSVRMGIHTGAAQERDGDYFGPTVNRAARIMSLAQPGQILISEVAQAVASTAPGRGLSWDFVGLASLRGVEEPVGLYRVLADGLPVLPGSLQERAPGNLKPPPTSFIGRDEEMGRLREAIGEHRLVTLIGVGGVGKTRLATEAAIEAFAPVDGAWLVELGLVDSEDGVGPAIASALGVRPSPGLSAEDTVIQWCVPRQVLLILDNCEHVLRSSAAIAQALLANAPQVTILATSREPLMVLGEHVFPVPSLGHSTGSGWPSTAAELFIDRARAELATFDPTGQEDVIEVLCRRLDGMPLALELAAARVRAMSVQAISDKLDERFRLLTGGRRTAVERHATLRATVDWSYDMLELGEQHLFDRLSVFAGPFEMSDAAELCRPDMDEFEVLDLLGHLVDRSLVVRGEESPYYRMLETLQAYGREQLDRKDQSEVARRRHAELMGVNARQALMAVAGPDEASVVAGIMAQIADYGAAATWAIENGEGELAAGIASDWEGATGPQAEGASGRWMRELAETVGDAEPWAARVFHVTAAYAMFFEGDLERASTWAGLAVAADPSRSMAHTMSAFAGMLSGRTEDLQQSGWSALETATEPVDTLFGYTAKGHTLLQLGQIESASEVADDWLRWATGRGYPSAIAMGYHLLGRVLAEEDPRLALEALEAGLDAAEAIPEQWGVRLNLQRESIPMLVQLDRDRALATCIAVLETCDRHYDTGNLLTALKYTALILHSMGDSEAASLTVGAAGEALLGPTDTQRYEEMKRSLRAELGDRYDELVARGSHMPIMLATREVLAALRTHADAQR